MNKHRILLIILITTTVAALALCGTVFAYMFRQTGYEDNLFTPAEVACKVVEVFDGVQKSSIQAQNTGNIDAYLRIRLVTYWVDSKGNIAAKPSSMPKIALADGWIEGPHNTYYYKTPINPGASTPELLSAPITLENDENGYLQVIEVFAEGIQSKPTKAVTDSWKVTLDANGNIVSTS